MPPAPSFGPDKAWRVGAVARSQSPLPGPGTALGKVSHGGPGWRHDRRSPRQDSTPSRNGPTLPGLHSELPRAGPPGTGIRSPCPCYCSGHSGTPVVRNALRAAPDTASRWRPPPAGAVELAAAAEGSDRSFLGSARAGKNTPPRAPYAPGRSAPALPAPRGPLRVRRGEWRDRRM